MKLTTSEATAILLCDGYISEEFIHCYKRPYYRVMQNVGKIGHQVGHITPKQFQEMLKADLIICYHNRTNKYGDIYNFYKICKGE